MIGSAVGKRYATALYDLAEENKVVPEVGRNLVALAAAWDQSDDLRNVFLSPQFGAEAKRDVIKAVTERLKCHRIVKNTMLMLADRQRLEHVGDISGSFERLAERRSGRIRAEVVTADKLSESYYASLKKTLEKATGKDVVLIRREDPSLIGGVVTTVNGKVFDGSLKNRLRGLRSQLLSSTDPAL